MTHPSHGSGTEPATVSGARCADTLIGARYEILEESERPGGFAAYKVRHVLLDSLLLLTALPEEIACDAQRLARVQAAVRAAGRLRHDHIVPVLDLVEEDGRYFIVEPLGDGAPLDRIIGTRPLDAPDALHVARQLADALAYAHAGDVVHGTVSPANILIETGSPPRARLSGFVLAALADAGSSIPAPFLPYTAPERLAGQAADACADVFGLGQVLFELFEGRPFFSGGRGAIEALLRDGTEPFLPRFSRVVPAGLSGLVARTIRRSAGERQQHMAHVRADLHACLRSIEQGSADSPEAPAMPPPASPGPAAMIAPRIDRPSGSADAAAANRNHAGEPPRAAGGSPPAVKRRRPATPPPLGGSPLRSFWPVRVQREATFPSRILVRATAPHRTALAGKLFMGGALAALGWALLPFAMPSYLDPIEVTEEGATPSRAAQVPVEPVAVPEPIAAVSDAPDVPAGPAATRAEPPRIEGRVPARDRVTLTAGEGTTFRVWAVERDAGHRLLYGWLLDGLRVGEGPEWRMVAPARSRASTHTVEVEVSNAAGLSAPRIAWTVEVTPARVDGGGVGTGRTRRPSRAEARGGR